MSIVETAARLARERLAPRAAVSKSALGLTEAMFRVSGGAPGA